MRLLGNSRWVHAMQWSGQKGFGASSDVPFLVEGSEAGLLKNYGPLTFLKVCLLALFLKCIINCTYADMFIITCVLDSLQWS